MSAFSNSLFIGLSGHLIFLVHFFLTISLSPLLQFLASSLFCLCSDSYRCCAGYLPVPFNILLCAARAEDQQTLTSLSFLNSWFSVNLGSRGTMGWSESRREVGPFPGTSPLPPVQCLLTVARGCHGSCRMWWFWSPAAAAGKHLPRDAHSSQCWILELW